MEIYTIATLAERCFLFEALLWIAFKKLPILDRYYDEDTDLRFCDDYDGKAEDYANVDDITPEDCRRVGLPPNPAYEYHVLGEGKISFNFLDTLDDFEANRNKNNLRTYMEISDDDISCAKEIRERYNSWLGNLDTFLMEAKLSLALKLLRGEIPAFARFCDDPELRKSRNYEGIEHSSSSKKIFQYNEINWYASIITHEGSEYFDVCVDTLALLREFPIDDAEVLRAHATGNALIVETQQSTVRPRKKRGRPAFPWPEMYVELGRRAERGELPAKQEALIAEMMDWCERNWSRRPSRSAIQSHLPPDIAKK